MNSLPFQPWSTNRILQRSRLWRIRCFVRNFPPSFLVLSEISLHLFYSQIRFTHRKQMQLLECLVPGISVRIRYHTVKDSLFKHSYYLTNITLENMRNCSIVVSSIQQLFHFESHFYSISDSAVAFQMINDDVENTEKQVIHMIIRYLWIAEQCESKTKQVYLYQWQHQK